MASLGSIQSQLSMPVAQLMTAWNSVRSASKNVARTTHTRQVHQTASATTSHSLEDRLNSAEVTNGVRETLVELGLTDLARRVTVEPVDPLLLKNTDSVVMLDKILLLNNVVDPLLDPEKSQVFSVSLPSLLTSGRQRHLLSSRWRSAMFSQPQRGFKTKRPKSDGFGNSYKAEEDSMSTMKYIKESMKSTSPAATTAKPTVHSDKFKTLLSEYESSPDLQDKMKVSFAEGYVAGNEGGPGVREGDPWIKRLYKMVALGITMYILYQVFQIIVAVFSKSPRLNQILGGQYYQVVPEDIDVRFDDVKGVDEAKEELQDVVEFLKNPDRFQTVGAKLPKGVLLCGPPGIGKTMLARAVAGEADVPFFHASGSEFDEMFVGVGAKRIRSLFDAAKAAAPCVIFLDEIDTVGAKRTNSETHPYANQTINQLLTEMDGFKQNEGVIVLGATNRRDNLDKALLRPGRFDVEVRVFPPDFKGRREILQHYLERVTTAPGINVDRMAHSTVGCTGADLANLVNQAAIKACLDGDTAVTNTHMEFAKDKILMGPVKKSRIPDEDTNKITACHEAGHALVAYHTKDATSPHKVTIAPRGMSLGHTSFVPEKEQFNMTRAQLLAEMDVAMGGRVAEEIVYGVDKVTTGAGSDFEKATGIAEALVKRFGMSEKAGYRIIHDKDFMRGGDMNEYSAATLEVVDSEIKRLLSESYERARALLKGHQRELSAIVDGLMHYETLDSDDLKTLTEGRKLTKEVDMLTGVALATTEGGSKAIKAILEGTKLPAKGTPQVQKIVHRPL